MKYKTYKKYKPSGIEWLGEIPEEWEMKRLKYISEINMGQSPDSKYNNDLGVGYPFLQDNADISIKYPFPKQFTTIANKLSKKGDLLFSVRAPVGALNESDNNYAIGRGLFAITPKLIISSLLWYSIDIVKSEMDIISTGSTFESVSVNDIENSTIPLPPLSEQKAIADFLDTETLKIDNLIEKAKQTIELSKEKRQALISSAVTGKIDVRGVCGNVLQYG